ncbi:UNVERIFIED_CONTAM: hypothetical protein HDU68_000411 [Siphonaria sp. JEL0065]|nr:hypothetical protein HDU68_000411 [Siphonaria sp. JEL0065]
MNSQVDSTLYPAVSRDVQNHTTLTQELGNVEPLTVKKGPISEDVYPAGVRAIENRGTAQQVKDLHRQEHGLAPIDNFHPGVARDQINNTHNMQELGNMDPLVAATKGPISEDLYPAGIRAIVNNGTPQQVADLHKMEHGLRA